MTGEIWVIEIQSLPFCVQLAGFWMVACVNVLMFDCKSGDRDGSWGMINQVIVRIGWFDGE